VRVASRTRFATIAGLFMIEAFASGVGPRWPRGRVRRDDWKSLVRAGLRLPGFMRAEVDRILWG
jgi:hypothetical protein